MEIKLNRLLDGKEIVFYIDIYKPYEDGGEGVLYRAEHEGKDYMLKVVELKEGTKYIYKRIIDRIVKIDVSDINKKNIREKILFSFMPYAQNYYSGSVFGYKSIKDVDVFAYSFVEGEKLSQFLRKNNDLSFSDRLNVCYKILVLLEFMQIDCGILHGDVFEDNFIVDQKLNIYPIDSTGCGYFDSDINGNYLETVYEPINRGKASNWAIPEPKNYQKSPITQHTDRWFAARLMWLIMSDRRHPYTFLKKIDASSIDYAISCIDKYKGRDWPPKFNKYPDCFNHNEYKNYSLYMRQNFGVRSKIATILYDYFIKGYQEIKKTPPLQNLINGIKSFELYDVSKGDNSFSKNTANNIINDFYDPKNGYDDIWL